MLDDVLPVIERPKESRQFMAVALANPWVAQDERMATKFMERNLLVGEQLVPGWNGDDQWIFPDWLSNDALAHIRGVREAEHEVA